MTEHDIIKNIVSKYSYVNDDVYVDKENHMYKIDGFQLGYIFSFMDYYDIGWKAVIAAFSDVFSRGGKPEFVLSSLGINKNQINEIDNILRGIKDACDYYNASYVGGDLNSSSNNGWIDISVIGKAVCYPEPKNIKEGDAVVITNPIGYTSLVFISYTYNLNISLSNIEKNKIRHPIVNKRLYDLFQQYCNSIHYSTDISDGLIISLYNIIERVNKGIRLTKFPFSNYVKEKIQKYNIKEEELLKYAGEEYETILILDKAYTEDVIDFMKYLGFSPIIIGEVISDSKLEYRGSIIKKTGWDNFSGWF